MHRLKNGILKPCLFMKFVFLFTFLVIGLNLRVSASQDEGRSKKVIPDRLRKELIRLIENDILENLGFTDLTPKAAGIVAQSLVKRFPNLKSSPNDTGGSLKEYVLYYFCCA